MRLCPWSLALASSIPVLGLESVCPRKGCPWPWPRIFLCPWPRPWPRALCPRLHLCKKDGEKLSIKRRPFFGCRQVSGKEGNGSSDVIYCSLNHCSNSCVRSVGDDLGCSIQDGVSKPSSVGLAHRNLKAALKTHENSTDWFSNLGFVLLVLRAVVKEDLDFSTSVITTGKTLRVPGQFVSGEHEHVHSSSDYRQQLVRYISSLRSTEPRHPFTKKTYLEKVLNDCTHVFIWNPTNKPPIFSSYDGSFQVLSKHDKYYIVGLVTRVDNSSIYRVKAAHLLRPGHDEARTFHGRQPASLTSATPCPIYISSPHPHQRSPAEMNSLQR